MIRGKSEKAKMSRTAGNFGRFQPLKKDPYEEMMSKSPKAKKIKFSLIYKMEEEDKQFIKQLAMINKTTKFEKMKFGILPNPRDGHSGLIHSNKMFIFGGDRNTFPFNDLYMFQFK